MEEERPIKVDLPNNPNMITYDSLIIDRSGSMWRHLNVTIEGVNKYIKDQQKLAAETGANIKASMRLFDTRHEDIIRFQPMQEMGLLDNKNYVPDGGTALNDALGLEIEAIKAEVGDKINSPDVDITITIFTDGQENSSTRYPRKLDGSANEELAGYVEELRSMGWTINYVGCGTEAEVKTAAGLLNVSASNVLNYSNDDKGYTHAFQLMSSARSVKTMNFTAGLEKSAENYFAPSITNLTPEEAAAIRPSFTNKTITTTVLDQGSLGSSTAHAIATVADLAAVKQAIKEGDNLTWLTGDEPEGDTEP